jgi:hypothetical protein
VLTASSADELVSQWVNEPDQHSLGAIIAAKCRRLSSLRVGMAQETIL